MAPVRIIRTALAAVVLIALITTGLAGTARAQGGLESAYHFSGNYDGSVFENGSLELTVTSPELPIPASAVEQRKKGRVQWSGVAVLATRVLTVRRSPTATPGLVGRLDGEKAPPVGSLEYVAVFDAAFAHAKVLVYRIGPNGSRQEIGKAVLRKDAPPWARMPGELIAIARGEIDKAIHKEIDLGKEFSIGSYVHVGARVGMGLVKDEERTPLMKEADRVFRAAGKGEPFWIRTVAEGGPRISWSTSIPIDPSGMLSLTAGFQAGAKIRYECLDQHKMPAGVTDAKTALAALEAQRARVLALPTKAGPMEALPFGTKRTLEGWGSIALTGGVSFGKRLEDLGLLAKKVELGASASAGVYWNMRGDFKVEVQREQEKRVRVKWTRSRSGVVGGYANAVVGLTVAPEVIKLVPGPANKVLSAVVKRGESYARVQFDAGASWTSSFELIVDLVFDLGDAEGRRGFEAAVLGNLITAQELAKGEGRKGLVEARVTSTLVDAFSKSVSLKAWNVLTLSWDSRSADVKVEVTDLDGTHTKTNTATWSSNRKGIFSDRTVMVDATERETTKPGEETRRVSTVTFRAKRVDDNLSYFVADQHLSFARLLLGSAVEPDISRVLAARTPGGDHGRSTLELEVTLGEKSIDRVLSTSRDDFLAAYGRAFWEMKYDWTPARCRLLESPPSGYGPDRTIDEIELEQEAYRYRDAKWAAGVLATAARGSRTERVEAFRKLARDSGFELRAVVAFATLADPGDRVVKLRLNAKGIAIDR